MIALDLYCGAGGASMELHRSGFFDQIVGVDIEDQPDYPFDFVQADVLDLDIDDFYPDFVWASPPCQAYTSISFLNRGLQSPATWRENQPDLVDATRRMIAGDGSTIRWTAIENVPESPVRPDIVLEGGNVGIANLKRRRKFEVSWTTLSPKPYTHGPVLLPLYGDGGPKDRVRKTRQEHGLPPTWGLDEARDALDVHWMTTRQAIRNCVPPKYATYIARDAHQRGLMSLRQRRGLVEALKGFAK